MLKQIDIERVNHFLLRKQHLTAETRIDNIVQIVEDVGGLHSTGSTTPYLSLFVRSKNFARDKFIDEYKVKRTLGKIRCVRRTIHVLSRGMIPVYYRATKKLIQPRLQAYLRYLGITEGEYKLASKSILEILKKQGMEMSGIKKELQKYKNTSGIANLKFEIHSGSGSTARSVVSSMVELMCEQGLMIRGLSKRGWKSNTHTYFLFDDYFPDVDLGALSEAEARKLLVRQYLSSFGPATEKDIAWWTGLGKTQITQALKDIEKEITYLNISSLEHDFIMLNSDVFELKKVEIPEKNAVTLLPAQDPYVMGYRERQRYLDYENYDYIFDRTGNAVSTILVDGRINGVWDFEDDKKTPLVKIFLFEELKADLMKTLHANAMGMGEFISSKKVKIKECDLMTPLSRRTIGSFMTPLRDS